jgi:hypothetical protein
MTQIKYQVRLENGELVTIIKPYSEKQDKRFKEGDEALVIFPSKGVKVFPYPKEGLRKALAVE